MHALKFGDGSENNHSKIIFCNFSFSFHVEIENLPGDKHDTYSKEPYVVCYNSSVYITCIVVRPEDVNDTAMHF